MREIWAEALRDSSPVKRELVLSHEEQALTARQAKLDVLDEVLSQLELGQQGKILVQRIRERVRTEELAPDTVSSNVEGFGYDRGEQVLTVRFPGGTYNYLAVPSKVYEEFLLAESRGSYLAREIKSKFKFLRVRI